MSKVNEDILNSIQGTAYSAWEEIKAKLKNVFGGGRWTAEEDLYSLIKTVKRSGQTKGQFVSTLLDKFIRVKSKMVDSIGSAEANGRMAFIATIMKVCLDDQVNERGEGNFEELARTIIEREARKEERGTYIKPRETETDGWTRQQKRPTRPMRHEKSEPQSAQRNWGAKPRPQGPNQRGFRRPEQQATKKCYSCGQVGHLASSCRKSKCFKCGNTGHFARECPYMYRRRRDEPMETDRQAKPVRKYVQQETASDEESYESGSSRRTYRDVVRGKKDSKPRRSRPPPVPETDFEEERSS